MRLNWPKSYENPKKIETSISKVQFLLPKNLYFFIVLFETLKIIFKSEHTGLRKKEYPFSASLLQ